MADTKVRLSIEDADVSWEDETIILASGMKCMYNAEYCINLQGQSYWSRNIERQQCVNKKIIIIFQGELIYIYLLNY